MSQGLIYDFFKGDNAPVVDITGTAISVNLQYSPDGVATNIKTRAEGDPNIPAPVTQALESANVSGIPVLPLLKSAPSYFDGLWGGYRSQIQTAIQTQLDNAFGKGKYSYTANLPKSGKVRARAVAGGTLLLDYWVSGLTVDLSASFQGNSGSFRITVDAELMIIITLSQWPSPKAYPTASLFNANISPTGNTAFWWSEIQDGYNFTHQSDNPAFSAPTLSDIIGSYEAIINASLVPDPDVSSLAAALAALGAAAIPIGLLQCVASTSQSLPSPLALNMVHPVDPPPRSFNPQTMASPFWRILGRPVLATSQTQVTAASQVGVTGSQFPPSAVVGIGWEDTCSGRLINSVVRWAPQGQPMTSITLTRPGNGPMYTLPITAQTGQAYQLQVSDSDALTTTQFSSPVTAEGAGTLELVLAYTSNSPGKTLTGHPPPPPAPPHPATAVVGTAAAGANGTLSVNIIIPADALPGSATLSATAMGMQIAQVQLTIVSNVQPTLNLIAPATGAVQYPVANPGFAMFVHGEGFLGGGEVRLHIDNAAGSVVATAMVANDGTFTGIFTWPQNLHIGAHTILAVEQQSGKTVQATLNVTQQAAIQ